MGQTEGDTHGFLSGRQETGSGVGLFHMVASCILYQHVFNLTHIRTTLSHLYLWINPMGVTTWLTRWTGKLAGGPQAGRSESTPLARVKGVGKQQQLQHDDILKSDVVLLVSSYIYIYIHIYIYKSNQYVTHVYYNSTNKYLIFKKIYKTTKCWNVPQRSIMVIIIIIYVL